MLDALLGGIFGSLLERIARRFANSAAALILLAFVAGLGAVPLIAFHRVWIGLALFAVSRLVAAIAGRCSEEDAATASVLGAVNFAALPFAFAFGDPQRVLPALVLMFGLSALFAASLKFGRVWIGNFELLLIFLLGGLLPGWFGIVAYISGVLCFVAAGVRIAAPRRIL